MSKARLTFDTGITVITWSNYADLENKIFIERNKAGRGKLLKFTYLD